MTDTLSGPTPAGAAVEALARTLSVGRGLRVHAIAGRGAVENVEDLLFLRGIDFAILNSDTLALAELTQRGNTARQRVRWLAHLFDRKVYLLAKGPVRRLSDLRGKPVGAVGFEANGYGAAQALFGLEQIKVDLTRLPASTPLDDAMVSGFPAVVLVGEELENWRPTQTGWRLIPIPLSTALSTAFTNTEIAAGEIPELTGGAAIPTLQRSTVLGMFNWGPTHSRYPLIQRFVAAFYGALPQLVATEPSAWRQGRMNAVVPGLQRHALAVPANFLTANQIAAMGPGDLFKPRFGPAQPVVAAPSRAPDRVVAPPPAAAAAAVPTANRIETPAPAASADTSTVPERSVIVSALVRPPLSDAESPTGGLVLDVLNQALRAAGSPVAITRQWHATPAALATAQRADGSIQISLPWIGLDCDRSTALTAGTALVCDEAFVSEPLVHVAFALHVPQRAGNAATPVSLQPGQRVCLQSETDPTVLEQAGQQGGNERGVTLVRRNALIDCILATEAGEADAVLAIDFEFTDLQAKLGLADRFRQMPLQLPPRGVHVAVSKSHPQSADILNRINRGVQTLKSSEAYAQSIMRHLRVQ